MSPFCALHAGRPMTSRAFSHTATRPRSRRVSSLRVVGFVSRMAEEIDGAQVRRHAGVGCDRTQGNATSGRRGLQAGPLMSPTTRKRKSAYTSKNNHLRCRKPLTGSPIQACVVAKGSPPWTYRFWKPRLRTISRRCGNEPHLQELIDSNIASLPRQRRWPPRGLGRDGTKPPQPNGG